MNTNGGQIKTGRADLMVCVGSWEDDDVLKGTIKQVKISVPKYSSSMNSSHIRKMNRSYLCYTSF